MHLLSKLTLLAVALSSTVSFTAMAFPASSAPVKNIVLVHGAFVGGSGWKPVYDILTKDEAQAQMLTSASVFTANIADPAWKTKPSWYMVAKSDKIISPDLERFYAKRAHSHTVEIAGASHSVYESHPQEVAALIEQAAVHALK